MNRKKILIVDDNAPVRRSLTAILRDADYLVHEAVDGVEAVRAFPQFRPDLVLLDMLMPNKDGLETLQELRAADPSVLVVAMSGGGYVEAELCLRYAQALGAGLILLKPFSGAELTAAVQAALLARKHGHDCGCPARAQG